MDGLYIWRKYQETYLYERKDARSVNFIIMADSCKLWTALYQYYDKGENRKAITELEERSQRTCYNCNRFQYITIIEHPYW